MLTETGTTSRQIEFDTGDGTTLRGTLFVPALGSGSVVVMAHGFSGVAEQIQHYAAAFAAAGVTTLVFDHRGFGMSDGAQRLEVDPWQQLNDWRDAIDAALQLPEVDASAALGVWGSSFAGGLAMILAATDPRVRCVVAQIPNVGGRVNARRLFSVDERSRLDALFLADRARRRRGEAPRTVPVFAADPGELCALPPAVSPRYIDAALRASRSWRNEVTVRSVENMLTFEPGGWFDNVSPIPLLMIVAQNDTCTFPGPQLEMYDSLPGPKKLVTHPGGHFDTYAEHFEVTMSAARDWFAEHLRKTPTSSS